MVRIKYIYIALFSKCNQHKLVRKEVHKLFNRALRFENCTIHLPFARNYLLSFLWFKCKLVAEFFFKHESIYIGLDTYTINSVKLSFKAY